MSKDNTPTIDAYEVRCPETPCPAKPGERCLIVMNGGPLGTHARFLPHPHAARRDLARTLSEPGMLSSVPVRALLYALNKIVSDSDAA